MSRSGSVAYMDVGKEREQERKRCPSMAGNGKGGNMSHLRMDCLMFGASMGRTAVCCWGLSASPDRLTSHKYEVLCVSHSKLVIKTLWIGGSLGVLENLALKSFLYHGHEVHLFSYGELGNVPAGVIRRDANDILSENDIFVYKESRSVAGFSNWFRYKMLYEEGGVWVDTDMICLKPFDMATPLFFGKEEYNKFNTAVIGAEKGQPVFEFLAQQVSNPNGFLPYDSFKDKKRKLKRRFLAGNQRGNVKWGETGPVGLTRALNHFGLGDFAMPITAFYPVHPMCWDTIFDSTYPDPARYFPDSYGVHLWNEMMKTKPGFDKNSTFDAQSLIEFLKRKYG